MQASCKDGCHPAAGYRADLKHGYVYMVQYNSYIAAAPCTSDAVRLCQKRWQLTSSCITVALLAGIQILRRRLFTAILVVASPSYQFRPAVPDGPYKETFEADTCDACGEVDFVVSGPHLFHCCTHKVDTGDRAEMHGSALEKLSAMVCKTCVGAWCISCTQLFHNRQVKPGTQGFKISFIS